MCVEGGGDGGAKSSGRPSQLSKSVQKKWLLNHIIGNRAAPGAATTVSGGLKVSSGGRSGVGELGLEHSRSASNNGKEVHIEADRRLNYEPCEDDYMTKYLNNPEVKKALNVKADIMWKMCSSKVR